MDRIRNQDIEGTAYVRCFEDKSGKTRLRWFEQTEREDSDSVGKKILRLELPRRRPGERTNGTFVDGVKEGVKLVGVSEEDAEDRVRRRRTIYCGDS